MPSFRGVKTKELIRSIDDGLYFLDEINPGPRTISLLNEWSKAVEPLEQIAQARNNEDLANVMGDTGAAFFFQRFHEVLLCQALMNVRGAFQTYRQLASWGAFDHIKPLRPDEIDEELNTFLICSLLNNLSESDLRPGSFAYARLQKAVYQLQEAAREGKIPFDEDDFVESDFVHGCQSIQAELLEHEGREAAGALIQSFDPDSRVFLKMVLREMNNINTNAVLLKDFSPLNSYAIVLPDTLGALNPFGGMARFAYALDEVLSPYYQNGDALGRVPGTARFDEGNAPAIFFTATRAAAQDVADAFPGYAVLSRKGERIEPGGGPKRLSGPRPPEP